MNDPGNILLPTAYFPPISWFIHLSRNRSAQIEQMETYPKQTYRNRCEIMTVSGRANLVVPITRPQGNHTMTRDIEICYREPWQQHHWKTLQTAYRSSPFFPFYEDLIRPLFEYRESSLVIYNDSILATLDKLLGIHPSIALTADYEKLPSGTADLRAMISPKNKKKLFAFPEYPQVFSHKHGFLADLSILDLLFNLGPDAEKYLGEECFVL